MKKINKITYAIVATTIATQILPVGSIVANAQQVNQQISTSREGQNIGLDNNLIDVRGIRYNLYGNRIYQGFSIRFDTENKTLKVTDKGLANQQMHRSFPDQTYFEIELFGSDGELKKSFDLQGQDNVEKAEQNLNNTKFQYGDYIKIYHKEGQSRLKIEGNIMNEDEGADFSQGVSVDTLNSNCFKITKRGLKEVRIHDILTNEITILGRQYKTARQGFRVRFDMTSNRMIVDKFGVKHAKMNLAYKNRNYITFELIRNGDVIDTLSLKGDDEVNKALLLQDMDFNLGDKIRITHEESGKQIKVSGAVDGAKSDLQSGVSDKTVTFELTDTGLREVNLNNN